MEGDSHPLLLFYTVQFCLLRFLQTEIKPNRQRAHHCTHKEFLIESMSMLLPTGIHWLSFSHTFTYCAYIINYIGTRRRKWALEMG